MKPHLILWGYVALIAVLLFAIPAHASTPPTISIPSVTVMENAGSAPVVILKTKASSYSKISVQTVDGTAKAGVDYKAVNTTLTLANSATSIKLPIALIDNATYQGPRSFALKVTVLRFGQLAAGSSLVTVTINDNEQPPAPSPTPHPCYDYSGTTPLGPVPGSNCPARYCPGTPNPVDWSLPCPVVTPPLPPAPPAGGSGEVVAAITACLGSTTPDPIAAGENYSAAGCWWNGAWIPLTCISKDIRPPTNPSVTPVP